MNVYNFDQYLQASSRVTQDEWTPSSKKQNETKAHFGVVYQDKLPTCGIQVQVKFSLGV